MFQSLEATINQSIDTVLKGLNTVESRMESMQKQFVDFQNDQTQVLAISLNNVAEQLQKATTQALQHITAPLAACASSMSPTTSIPPTSVTVSSPIVVEKVEESNPEATVPDNAEAGTQNEEVVADLPSKNPPIAAVSKLFTGEGFEDILFEGRAKLYIFDSTTKVITERGVGEIKILYNLETKSHRALMQCEKTQKLHAHFRICKDMKIVDKNESCGIFHCKNYEADDSEGTSVTFYIRFKESNIYGEFKQLFIDIASGNPNVYYGEDQEEDKMLGDITEDHEEDELVF